MGFKTLLIFQAKKGKQSGEQDNKVLIYNFFLLIFDFPLILRFLLAMTAFPGLHALYSNNHKRYLI